jgi:hypothetical protein
MTTGTTKFACGLLSGLMLGVVTGGSAATLAGAGLLVGWTVTGDGKSGEPRMEICFDPTIDPFDRIIECHLNPEIVVKPKQF